MLLGLGFDTGGTYTDAVIMNLETDQILMSSKALTTRYDLSIGIKNSIKNFNCDVLNKISLVSLSSTLATNSIVEGKGCRVGLICIGEKYDNAVSVDAYACIKGCHDLSGNESEPLDIDAAEKFFNSIKGKVDGLAITGYLSVRNPEHEICIKKLANRILNIPAVCGHELSSGLGFNERTTTCIMNARLIPIIKDLIDSVNKVLYDNNIKAPLMIVKGDGSIMDQKMAKERPVETILSGPAASMIGARKLTGQDNAIVMDIGGTTTDIGILRNGRPRLEKEGALIGEKRTKVLAADIATSGIGGDSRIVVNGQNILLMPTKAIPLCVAANKWPDLKRRLEKIATEKVRPTPEAVKEENIIQETEFFIKIKNPSSDTLSSMDLKFLDIIKHEPLSLSEAGEKLNVHPLAFNASKLEGMELIQRIGLTPTDLLHAEGSYLIYDAEASKLGILHQATKLRIATEEFIFKTKKKFIDKLCMELMKKLMFEETGLLNMDCSEKILIMKAIEQTSNTEFDCMIKLNKPIIGIGAPVAAYLPAVAKRFNTKLYIPEYSEVGNAIGALTSSIIESIEVLVKPNQTGNSDDSPCLVFATFGKTTTTSYEEGLELAKFKGKMFVKELAEKAGAVDITVSYDVNEKRYSTGDDMNNVLLETIVTVTAVGKPKQFS